MKHTLYFICPTDGLESVINEEFNGKNYFLTSLGNSISIKGETIKEIKELIKEKNITDIHFILSYDNHIMLDAVISQEYKGMTKLNEFYEEIGRQRKRIDRYWKAPNYQNLVLSNHLNAQIKHLKKYLGRFYFDLDQISGYIYNNEKREFTKIYSKLICNRLYSLN